MDTSWLQERITATKALIEAYETALTTLSAGTQKSYMLDTGQTKTAVTKKDVGSITKSLNSAYNLLATLEARLDGAAVQSRPAW